MSLINKTDQELLAIAEPMMDNIIKSSTALDYKSHVKDFSERIKTQLNEETLLQICKKYQEELGQLTDRKFVRLFRRPDSIAFIWEQHFSKSEGEYVAEMVLIEHEGKVLIDHIYIH